MKDLTTLSLAALLGLALIPTAAQAQEYGGVPNNAYQQTAPIPSATGGFQALAGGARGAALGPSAPAGDYTADQLEGMMSIHMGH